jgi:NADPH-dependent 2,4-dienoyl-CoA reductase/sulfur reductase-like enzyme
VPERLVVIGGDAAGMSAASQARRRRGAEDLEIVAFERGSTTSYSACGIPYWIGDVVESRDALITRTPQTFRNTFAIDVRIRTEVEEIDLDRREVRARDLENGATYAVGFDSLLVATGSVPVRPPLPGIDAIGVYGVQVLDDGDALRAAVEAGARGAVVVGGGYIGIELAEALTIRGVEVTLVEMAPEPMSTMDPDMGAMVRGVMNGLGIRIHSGERVAGIETGPDNRVSAVVTDRRTIPTDLVVLGLGVRPNVALAQAAGITCGPTGAISTDLRMRTHVEGVWAAGDCVQTYHLVSRMPVHIPLGTHANKQGRVAGINLGGGYATFPGVVGTAVSKVCSLEIARTGLKEVECERAGFAYVTATVKSTTRAGYFPGATTITTKMIAEKRSGRLLGGQIVGEEGAAKRIDAIATALWNEMTVEDMANLDLSYAPPFAPVWDPVLIAARKAWDAVEADVAHPAPASAVG